jgi:Flp pilus assembly protein TadD
LERTRQALAAVPEDWRLRELAARLLGGLDDYAGAIAEWEQVSRRIPHAAGPFIELGKLEFARGGTAPARAWFHQAITVNPDAAEAWQGLGWVNRREGRTAEAERCFRNARRLDPAGNAKGEDPRRAAEP